MTEQQAKKELEPIASKLVECAQVAWNGWLDIERRTPHDLSKRTRANVVYDLLTGELHRQFLNDDFVCFSDQPQNSFLVVGGTILLRFNKLEADLTKALNPTQISMAFADQEQLFKLPRLANLQLGYVLDDIGRSIDRVVVYHPAGANGRPNWVFDLLEHGDESRERIAVAPSPDLGNSSARIVAKPKTPAVEEAGEEQG